MISAALIPVQMKINPLLLKVTRKVRKMWWREESRNTGDPAGGHDVAETCGLYRERQDHTCPQAFTNPCRETEQDKKNAVKG